MGEKISLGQLIKRGEIKKILTDSRIRNIIMRGINKYNGRGLEKNVLREWSEEIIWELSNKYRLYPETKDEEARIISYFNKEFPRKLLNLIAKEGGKYYNRGKGRYEDKFKTVSLYEIKSKETGERWIDILPAICPNILDILIRQEDRERIEKIIDKDLSPKQKEAMCLCDLGEMTEAEAAHKLGVTRSAIHRRRTKGIKKIRKILKGGYHFPETASPYI